MEIATSLPVQAAYKAGGERSRVMASESVDPVGGSLFGNLLQDPVCADSIGHPLEQGLAAFPEVLVQATSPFGDSTLYGTLLLTR